MKKLFELISISSLLLFMSYCDENPIDNEETNFGLEVIVVDNNSNGLPNINISTWNKIQLSTNSLSKEQEYSKIQATTSIGFSLSQKSCVNLTINDLEGNEFKKIIDNKTFQAGSYSYQYQKWDNIGTGVYKCKLRITEDSLSSSIIFTDSIYSVILSPDPTVSKIGVTTSNGQFNISNRLLFPNLYDLPELILTGEGSPEPLATFSISDEIVIALSNNNSQTKYFERSISDNKNKITLNWDKGSDEPPSWILDGSQNRKSLDKVDDNSMVVYPMNFELTQNYPNPFN